LGYVGNKPALNYTSFAAQHFTTSATTTYTLDHAVTNENDIRLVINNVVQQPGSGKAYIASGTTLTLSAATSGTDTMYCVFLGKAVQTVVPAQGSVGSDELSADAITGQSALGAEPADTDEFIISDSGVLKRVDYSHIKAPDGVSLRPNVNPLIINGDMAVAQRGTSVTGITTSAYHTIDRWNFMISNGGTWTQTQNTSSVLPNYGFRTSLKLDNTTADASLGAADYLKLQYTIEAQDCQLFQFGQSTSETLTLGFWVKATKTGTNIVELLQADSDRICCQSYTVSVADTWEYKVLNFPADTSGTGINNDNGEGLEIYFHMGAGSNYTSGTLATTWAARVNANRAVGQVNNADSTSNNFEITGVQLEVGEYTSSTLPPFQHESFSENLHRCCRYFFYTGGGASYQSHGTGVEASSTAGYCNIPLPNILRASPSISFETALVVWDGNSESPITSLGNVYYAARGSLVNVACNCSGGGLDDAAGLIVYSSNDSTSGFLIDSEL